MIIELHKTEGNIIDAVSSLFELKEQLEKITLDQIGDGIQIDVRISSRTKENGEYEECKNAR